MYAWVLQRLMEDMEKSKLCRAAGMAYCPGKKSGPATGNSTAGSKDLEREAFLQAMSPTRRWP